MNVTIDWITKNISSRTLAMISAALLIVLGAICILACVHIAYQSKQLATAQAFSDAQQQIIDSAQLHLKQRQEAWEKERKAWEKERAEIKTAKQAVKIIEKYVPIIDGHSVVVSLPAPDPAASHAPLEETKPTECKVDAPQDEARPAAPIAPEILAQLPKAESYVVKTDIAEIETAKALQAGKQCEANLLKCSEDIDDFRIQIESLERDRDRWRSTAKGGGWVKRIFKGFAIGACGAGGAAIGANEGSNGAAIGSLAGAATCALLTR